MCYTNLLMNPKGYYFSIHDSAMDKLDYATLAKLEQQGCQFASTLEDLYKLHIDFCNEQYGNELCMDEVAGMEYTVLWMHGDFVYMCDRGITCVFDGNTGTQDGLVKALMEFEL